MSQPTRASASESTSPALGKVLNLSSHNPSMNRVREAVGGEAEVIDFCVPVNPYFPPPRLLEQMRAQLPDLLKHYPDYAGTHEQHIAEFIDAPPACVVAANGSTEIITSLCRESRGPMVTTVPTFGRWTDLPGEAGTPMHTVPHRRSRNWRVDVDELLAQVREVKASSLVLCNPNNPTGAWFSDAEIGHIVRQGEHLASIVIDESFIDFSSLNSAKALAIDSPNTIIVKSMGKSLGWHGVRLGYSVSNPGIAARLRSRLPWWNVNGLAAFVLKNLPPLRGEFLASFEKIARDRQYMHGRLAALGRVTVFPSQANFLYVELPPGVCGKALRVALLERHGLFVRECGNKIGSSESYLRLAVLPWRETDLLVEALGPVLDDLRLPEPRIPACA